jgi:hypothetical protein
VAQDVGPEFKPQYSQKKEKTRADGVTKVLENLPSKCEALSFSQKQKQQQKNPTQQH